MAVFIFEKRYFEESYGKPAETAIFFRLFRPNDRSGMVVVVAAAGI